MTEQANTKPIRTAGRPSKALLARLKPWTHDELQKLLAACVEAYLLKENDVRIRVHYLFKLPAGFPKGIKTKIDLETDERRCKVRRVLAWLREQGHTTLTFDDLGKELRELTIKERKLFDGYSS